VQLPFSLSAFSRLQSLSVELWERCQVRRYQSVPDLSDVLPSLSSLPLLSSLTLAEKSLVSTRWRVGADFKASRGCLG
jgi:hypothetical protein